MKRFAQACNSILWISVLLAVSAAGCTKTVMVRIPPRIDLQAQPTIGIIQFSSNEKENLNQYATQKFMSEIQGAQPKVRFLELGSEKEVLGEVGHERMAPDAVKAIGKKYGVNSVFAGNYETSEVKPKLNVGMDLKSINASATVNMTMAVKQWDTDTGATLWTNSRSGEWSVAKFNKKSGNLLSMSVSDPEDQYQEYLSKLVFALTNDFRPHFKKQKVKD